MNKDLVFLHIVAKKDYRGFGLKQIVRMMLFIIITCLFIVLIENSIEVLVRENEYRLMNPKENEYRANFFSEDQMENKERYNDECKSILRNVEREAIYYPVAESSVDKSYTTTFVNSWMSERTFGGKRGHEGVDIMASKNKRGIYPIVSMTDGVVTNLGWLEKGGYRIGITSDSGIYYYYAHLDSYANIQEGQRVSAGEFLGYMGDSGYGTEGTKGKFDVHLHVGIYVYYNNEQISMNPYYILRKLENNKLKYVYS